MRFRSKGGERKLHMRKLDERESSTTSESLRREKARNVPKLEERENLKSDWISNSRKRTYVLSRLELV
ncbi:hypothetical protein BVRB_000820 [Beta vulgaris subsp. vulgaris]|uniref:Uncharacterized protein n=1 Tax=Beta vulgaris subsp. vulgaris TaxID=3555 RepID=A0A0J8B5F7_BETVV|nr:hypothetical protein BVRB_000820 [Beta vulgaris subsp. vulgaris]